MIFNEPIAIGRFAGGKSPFAHSDFVAPPHPFGDSLTLPLGQCREHGNKNFAGHLRGVNVLLLKVDADVERLQFPYSRQTFLGIPGEAGGRFHKDAVDAPFSAVLHHP